MLNCSAFDRINFARLPLYNALLCIVVTQPFCLNLSVLSARNLAMKGWAGLAELRAFPLGGETLALPGFDGLDAAGVVFLQENATAVFLLYQ